VDVGLLCHPGKLTPPSHVVKYTGLIFDTTSEPILRVPDYKVDKATAMIDYVLAQHERISWLSLSVVVGILESMVEATPARVGHTYLHHLHTILHPLDWDGSDLPYFSFTSLDERSTRDLHLWKWLLTHNDGWRARAIKSGTLIPSFGDGSGTGTGGTVRYNDDDDFEMWMGVWSPRVYRFSSNWMEARTLLATLQRARDQNLHDIRGVTSFNFTDNMTTYYTVTSGSSASPGIHSLVEEIKRLEIELGIVLEVIHVPGTTIITEGTDGLSRGIWSTPLHQRPDRHILLAEIFAPISFTTDVGDWAVHKAGIETNILWERRSWELEWRAEDILDRLTVWAPPPEVAPQLIYDMLQLYVEKPRSTAMIFLILRVLQRRWSRLSRCVHEVGVYPRSLVPIVHNSYLTIPIVVLLIPFHVR
jgi:hypothetical protein